MKIYGLDFTSAPSERKPITCARCFLKEGTLRLVEINLLTSFEVFETFLMQPGPWVAGLDFPFGQPCKLIDNIGWPRIWEGYINLIGAMSKDEFVSKLEKYRQSRPKGDKQHLRRTDELANSRSPMMLFGVPVGKMFFEGAPRLLRSGACIHPCRPNNDQRILVEAYPALVVRRWSKGQSYKSDEKRKQNAARQAVREEIISGLCTNARNTYGLDVQIPDNWADKCVQDGSGDQLDALLCGIQAGWANSRHEQNYGIPIDCDPLEGWIVDPFMAGKETTVKK
jgi:hypothetical protein